MSNAALAEPGPQLGVVEQAAVAGHDRVRAAGESSADNGRVAGIPEGKGDLDPRQDHSENEDGFTDVALADAE